MLSFKDQSHDPLPDKWENKSKINTKNLFPTLSSASVFHSCFFMFRHLRAQEVFRQAMHSPTVCLEVVPPSTRERYEKSLIGQLFGNGAGPDSSPHGTKTKAPPPPVKAKPNFKPSESPAVRMAEEVAAMETALSVRHLAASINHNVNHRFLLSLNIFI